MEVSGPASRSGSIASRERRTGTHWIRDWVGSDVVAKKADLLLPGIKPRSLLTELSRPAPMYFHTEDIRPW